MSRAPAIAVFAASAALAAGCGGAGDGGDSGAAAGGGACATAKTALRETIAERDRLFVDQQLQEATQACDDELEDGDPGQCTTARADLEAAAAEETPPDGLDELVDSAVEACAGTKITSTIPAP